MSYLPVLNQTIYDLSSFPIDNITIVNNNDLLSVGTIDTSYISDINQSLLTTSNVQFGSVTIGNADPFTLPLTDGTANQVLQTDGAGNVTWQDQTDTNIYNSNGTFGAGRNGTLTDTLTINGSTTGTVQFADAGALTASGTVQGNTLTDGTASLNSGSLTSAINVTASGTVQGGILVADQITIDNNAITVSGTNDLLLNVSSSQSIDLQVNGVNVLSTSGTGVTFGNADPFTLPLTDGTANQVLQTDGAGNVSWQDQTDTNTNIYNTNGTLTGARTVSLATNTLSFTGGTTDISSLSVNSAFTFPTSDGTVNQVLQTDGSGNVSWQNQSANTNIYDTNGNLSGNRTVTLNSNTLDFVGSAGNVSIDSAGVFTVDNESIFEGGSGFEVLKVKSDETIRIGRTDTGQRLIIDPNQIDQYVNNLFITCYNNTTPQILFRTGPSAGNTRTTQMTISDTEILCNQEVIGKEGFTSTFDITDPVDHLHGRIASAIPERGIHLMTVSNTDGWPFYCSLYGNNMKISPNGVGTPLVQCISDGANIRSCGIVYYSDEIKFLIRSISSAVDEEIDPNSTNIEMANIDASGNMTVKNDFTCNDIFINTPSISDVLMVARFGGVTGLVYRNMLDNKVVTQLQQLFNNSGDISYSSSTGAFTTSVTRDYLIDISIDWRLNTFNGNQYITVRLRNTTDNTDLYTTTQYCFENNGHSFSYHGYKQLVTGKSYELQCLFGSYFNGSSSNPVQDFSASVRFMGI